MMPPAPTEEEANDAILRHLAIVFRHLNELPEHRWVTQQLHARLQLLHADIVQMHTRTQSLVRSEMLHLLQFITQIMKKRARKHPIRRLLTMTTRHWKHQLQQVHRECDQLIAKMQEPSLLLQKSSVVNSKASHTWPKELEKCILRDTNHAVRYVRAHPDWVAVAFRDKSTEYGVFLEVVSAFSMPTAFSKAQIEGLEVVIDRFQRPSRFFPSGLHAAKVPSWFLPSYSVDFNVRHGFQASLTTTHRGLWLKQPVVIKCLWLKPLISIELLGDWLTNYMNQWKQLDFPFLVPVLGACHVQIPVFLVRDQVPNGNVTSFLTKIDNCGAKQRELIRVFQQAMQALVYLHDHGIVHGNLKCSNLLMDKKKDVKLADYGLWTALQEAQSSFGIELPSPSPDDMQWYAPECLETTTRTIASDVYAMGMCMIEAMRNGDKPYGHLKRSVVIQMKRNGQLPDCPVDWKDADPRLWQLIAQLCHSEPSKRLAVNDAVQVLDQLMDSKQLIDPHQTSEDETTTDNQSIDQKNAIESIELNQEMSVETLVSVLEVEANPARILVVLKLLAEQEAEVDASVSERLVAAVVRVLQHPQCLEDVGIVTISLDVLASLAIPADQEPFVITQLLAIVHHSLLTACLQRSAGELLLNLAARSASAKEWMWKLGAIDCLAQCPSIEHDMVQELEACVAKGKHATAMLLMQENALESAISLLSEAIQLDKKRWEYYADRSLVYSTSKLYQEAVKDAVRAIKLHPYGPRCEVGYLRQAHALCGLRQYDQALAIVRKGLQFCPVGETLALEQLVEEIRVQQSQMRERERLVALAERLQLTLAQWYEQQATMAIERHEYDEALGHLALAIEEVEQEDDRESLIRLREQRIACYEAMQQEDQAMNEVNTLVRLEATN